MSQNSCSPIVVPSWENVLVIIPVRNEEKTIVAVIRDLQSFGLTKIRVIDNGSSDRSAEVAKSAGAEVLFNRSLVTDKPAGVVCKMSHRRSTGSCLSMVMVVTILAVYLSFLPSEKNTTLF